MTENFNENLCLIKNIANQSNGVKKFINNYSKVIIRILEIILFSD